MVLCIFIIFIEKLWWKQLEFFQNLPKHLVWEIWKEILWSCAEREKTIQCNFPLVLCDAHCHWKKENCNFFCVVENCTMHIDWCCIYTFWQNHSLSSHNISLYSSPSACPLIRANTGAESHILVLHHFEKNQWLGA